MVGFDFLRYKKENTLVSVKWFLTKRDRRMLYRLRRHPGEDAHKINYMHERDLLFHR